MPLRGEPIKDLSRFETLNSANVIQNNERNQIGENIEATNKQLSIDSEGCLKKQDTCHVAFEDKETLSALDKPKCSDKSCRGHHTFNETNDESTSEQCLQTSYTTEG